MGCATQLVCLLAMAKTLVMHLFSPLTCSATISLPLALISGSSAQMFAFKTIVCLCAMICMFFDRLCATVHLRKMQRDAVCSAPVVIEVNDFWQSSLAITPGRLVRKGTGEGQSALQGDLCVTGGRSAADAAAHARPQPGPTVRREDAQASATSFQLVSPGAAAGRRSAHCEGAVAI